MTDQMLELVKLRDYLHALVVELRANGWLDY